MNAHAMAHRLVVQALMAMATTPETTMIAMHQGMNIVIIVLGMKLTGKVHFHVCLYLIDLLSKCFLML